MLSRMGVRRLWVELVAAVVFAAVALVLGKVYADEPGHAARDDCVQGLPALQIELLSAQAGSLQCMTGARREP